LSLVLKIYCLISTLVISLTTTKRILLTIKIVKQDPKIKGTTYFLQFT